MEYEIIEHLAFSTRWSQRSTPEELTKLRNLLVQVPDHGDSIPGCGMLRKLRVADPSRHKGKRGGLRVIYLHTKEAKRIRLLTAYGKDEKSDLSAAELKAWCEVARVLRKSDEEWGRKQAREE